MASPADTAAEAEAETGPSKDNGLLQHQHSSNSLQVHRQNHTPSKLPAFRFADVRDSLAVLGVGLLQRSNNKQSSSAPEKGPASSGTGSGSGPGPGPGPGATAGVPSPSPTKVASLTAVDTAHHQQGHPQNITRNPENSSPHQPAQPGPRETLAETLAETQTQTQTQTLAASAHPTHPTHPAPAHPTLLTPVTEASESPSTTIVHADGAADTNADAPESAALDPEPPTLPSVRNQTQNGDNTSTSAHSPHSSTSLDGQSPRSRASTYETASTSAPITPTAAKRSVSAPSRIDDIAAAAAAARTPGNNTTPAASQSQTDTESPCFYTPATRPRARRANSSPGHSASAPSPGVSRARRDAPSPGAATKQWAHDQRERGLPRAITGFLSDDDKKIPRRKSTTSRPPSSYKPPPLAASIPPGHIPPIRSFRSSGSRKSSLPDMNDSTARYYDDGEDYRDLNQRDRSLRALEGARTPPDADDEVTESENNTADIFMRIAREDSSSSVPRRSTEGGAQGEQDGTVSRVVLPARAPRQRPMSGIYNTSYQRSSSPPPPRSRRLSDQQIPMSRVRRAADEADQNTTRDMPYQGSVVGRPSLKLDSARASSRVSTLKPSPITPRTQSVLDNSADRNSIFARRPSTKPNDGHSRSSSVRQPTGLSKSFNSSPLVSKAGETHHAPGGHHEASESSNSTAAPSTVWDELDELKSRIHRLELTGKMPKTSGAAISRTSDERPPTAGTGATTISGSPKRAQTEVVSTTSSHREAQPILKSALSKTKAFVNSDVYDAIEAAANDALSLSQMMGPPGQAGPISSGASTIGAGGPNTVTDRQLRKKAESICRSLTELCLALTDQGTTQRRSASSSRPQTGVANRPRDDEAPSSPPTMRIFTGRQSAGADEPLPSIEPFNSPRATRLDKRATFNFTGMHAPSSMPSPRYASSVVGGGGGGGDDTVTGRKSSLVIARARRGLTEEPEDHGRKTALLRTRRANTEEPEEEESSHNRRSSLILAPRRVTTISRVSNIDEEPQPGSRAPSRAVTELNNGLRIAVPSRDSIARRPQALEPASASAVQGPRRLLTSNLPASGPYSSRLSTPTTPGARRFLQVSRQAQDREDTTNITGRLNEDRGQRYSIGAPPSNLTPRGPSLHRKRHSGIPNISGTASNVGSYR